MFRICVVLVQYSFELAHWFSIISVFFSVDSLQFRIGLVLVLLLWPCFHNSLPLNNLHYCLPENSVCHPLKICQGASSSTGIDKEFGGLGQEAINIEILDISGFI